MVYLLAVWATTLACLLPSIHTAGLTSSVAIIGGGVGGASAAFYLKRQQPGSAVTVFEREAQLGGRAQEVQYGGLTLELGASIVWHNNYLLTGLAAAAGLQRENPEPDNQGDSLFAIYDGRELVFEESPWRLLTLFRLLWRYWLSWFMVRSAPAATFAKFEGIYTLLEHGTTFERPADLLQAVGLYDLTQASMLEYLRDRYGSRVDLVGQELIGGINRVNYNQGNSEVNALAGMVSLLPATDPGVFRIKGGNSQLAPRLLQLANATVRCQAAVTSVQRLPDGRFELELKPSGAAAAASAAAADEATDDSSGEQQPQRHGPFDTVIIASPLEASGLSFVGVHLPIIPARKYQQVVTTLVKGSVRPSYFGLSEMIYSQVMVSDNAEVPWNSLALVGRTVAGNATVWKLFSRQPMPGAWLGMMFEKDYKVVAAKVWDAPGAYPKFDAPEDFAPFKLAEGLFYASALENAASAMEIAAIEGRMAALLAVQHLRQAASASQQQQGSVLDGPGQGAANQQKGVAAAA